VLGILGFGVLNYFLTRQEHPQPRGPYLQSVTPHSIWVVWDTTEPSIGRVEYGQTSELGRVVEETTPVLHHEVQLTGLNSYTDYYYRVDGDDVAKFRTAADSDQTNFSFAVLGDTRSGVSTHKQIIKQMVAMEPDFFLHTGDMVESGRFDSEWNRFFKIEGPLLRIAPFYPTLGNHEEYDAGLANSLYLDVFHLPGNELWYAFDYGNARFICLKVDANPRDDFSPDAEQMLWLEQQLAGNEAPWLFVYFHVGVFTSRSEDALEIEMREKIVPIFEAYDVDVVFMGHHHSYERILVNGITYIVTAGGGASLYEFSQPEPDSQAAILAHHFVAIEVDGDRLHAKVIDQRGKIIESFDLPSTK
jgi:predicted phosphodiesterase